MIGGWIRRRSIAATSAVALMLISLTGSTVFGLDHVFLAEADLP